MDYKDSSHGYFEIFSVSNKKFLFVLYCINSHPVMTLLFLWLVSDLLTGLSSTKICSQLTKFKIVANKIPASSSPAAAQYRLDWAAAAEPDGSGVCLSSVTVFYDGEDETCCRDYKQQTKSPNQDNDLTPFMLDLCGQASRMMFLNFTYKKHHAIRKIKINDDIPPCKDSAKKPVAGKIVNNGEKAGGNKTEEEKGGEEKAGKGSGRWKAGLALGILAVVLVPLGAFLSIKFNMINNCR